MNAEQLAELRTADYRWMGAVDPDQLLDEILRLRDVAAVHVADVHYLLVAMPSNKWICGDRPRCAWSHPGAYSPSGRIAHQAHITAIVDGTP